MPDLIVTPDTAPIASLDDPRVPTKLREMILQMILSGVWWMATHNAHRLCERVSRGCENCYMFRETHRMRRQVAGAYTGLTGPTFFPGALGRFAADRVPKIYFTPSMSDWLYEGFGDETVSAFFDAMYAAPWHYYMSPTKRADRLAEIGPYLSWGPNKLAMVSVEDADTLWRIERLRDCGAPQMGVSFEPVIDRIPLRSPYGRDLVRGLDYAVVGGETAPKEDVRPMDIEHARELIEVLQEEGVPTFFKQVGSVDFDGNYVGVKAAGRELDGVPFDALPAGCLDHLARAWVARRSS